MSLLLKSVNAEKKVDKGKVIKHSRPSDSRQLMLIKLEEQKERWNYNHPEDIKVTTKQVVAFDSQPFSIVVDTGFIRLLATVSPQYVAPSREHFLEKIISEIHDKLREMLFDYLHSDYKISFSFTANI